jgi:hypothetical protein
VSHVIGSSEASRTTAITTGASFEPDSSSSIPASRGETPTPRSTLNTAAASVEASTAPHRNAARQSRPSSRCSATPTTPMLTTTPTVESAMPTPSDGRTALQRVVRPPSARISTSAAHPIDSVSGASENWMPTTDSPRRIPIPR